MRRRKRGLPEDDSAFRLRARFQQQVMLQEQTRRLVGLLLANLVRVLENPRDLFFPGDDLFQRLDGRGPLALQRRGDPPSPGCCGG